MVCHCGPHGVSPRSPCHHGPNDAPLWSPWCAIIVPMVCHRGPPPIMVPTVRHRSPHGVPLRSPCHHSPHGLPPRPPCHLVPPSVPWWCPWCSATHTHCPLSPLCTIPVPGPVLPPPAPRTAWGHRGPPQGWDGDTRGVGMAATAPPSAWGQGATRPYSAGADTPVGFLWGGRGAGYRTPFCAPPHPLGALLAAGGAEENAFGKQRPGSHGAGEGGARGGSVPCSGGGGWWGWRGGLCARMPPSHCRGWGCRALPTPLRPPRLSRAHPPARPPQPPPEPAARMELELLDLSFLTEAERCAIAEVLHRDALLRRTEEGRVRWDPPGPPVGGDRRGVSPGGSRTQWEAAAVPSLGHVPSTSSVSPTRSASPTCAVTSPHPHLCPPVLICHQPFYVPHLVRVPNFICAPSTSAVPPPV